MYQVLVEIREESYLLENKKIHHLSNLMHNVPLMLLHAENQADFDAILIKVQEKAEHLGMGKWFSNCSSQL